MAIFSFLIMTTMRRRRILAPVAVAVTLLLTVVVVVFSNNRDLEEHEEEQIAPNEDAIRASFNEFASSVLNGGIPSSDSAPARPPSPDLSEDSIAGLFNVTSYRFPALQVWPRLKPLALRPDLFFQAKDAIAEAVLVWRQLLLHLDKEQHEQQQQHLPECHQLSTRTNTSRQLGIPCGLNLDSSITLIGVPSGSFGINLQGSSRHILSYKFRLEDNDSVLIHTSGHSREECPLSSNNNKTVDGLSTCAHITGGAFPIVSHLPFVCTIWLGWHGFHMSVNGKHVSSFKYRQDREPWLVTSVNVTGSVEVSSLMATGLPVSESRDAIPSYLRAPPVSKPVLFIGVFSTANNFARRMAIRRSWMQYDAVRSGRVVTRFFVGLDKSPEVNRAIWAEARDYEDMQLLPFVDYYELITLKTLAICIYAVKVVKTGFVMKADDDTFVRVDEIVSLIHLRISRQGFLLGVIEFSASPNREEGEKWYINEQEWPHLYYPPWAHGAGYVVSSEIVKYVVHSYEKSRLRLFRLEDVAMGIWIDDYKREKRKDVEYVHHDRFFHLECREGYVIAHYQKPADMTCLWQHLRSGKGPVCCETSRDY